MTQPIETMTRTGRLATLILFAAMLAGVAGKPALAADDYDHAGLARQALEDHIRPGYRRLREAMEHLANGMDALCDASSAKTLERARDAFRLAALVWASLEHLRFGPAVEEHRYERLAYWPDPKGLGRRQVRRVLRKRDGSALVVETLEKKSVALQGLTALEVLLYGNGGEALGEEGKGDEFRCRYALAIARNGFVISQRIEQEWSEDGDYAKLWLSPGPDNPVYRKAPEVSLELVKAYRYGLELARDVKLVSPLGMRFPGQRPSRPQYDLAGLSIPALAATLDGVTRLYAQGGLEQRLEEKIPDIARLITNELRTAKERLQEIELSGKRAFRDEEAQERLIAMGFPIKNAMRTGGVALAGAAGLAIGFNAGDGD